MILVLAETVAEWSAGFEAFFVSNRHSLVVEAA
jgi:hypothetical protein